MSAADQLHRAVQSRLESMPAAERAKWLERFAYERDFETYLYDSVEREIRDDIADAKSEAA